MYHTNIPIQLSILAVISSFVAVTLFVCAVPDIVFNGPYIYA